MKVMVDGMIQEAACAAERIINCDHPSKRGEIDV